MPEARTADTQAETFHFLTFEKFERMNTRMQRQALKKEELAWQENLQPIGDNNLQAVPAPAAAPLATLTGETVTHIYFVVIGTVDYAIVFTAAGAGYGVNLGSGASTKFANAGTFSNPDCTQWQSSLALILDPTAGYCSWDGTTFNSHIGGQTGTTLAVFGGRVWLANGRVLTYTGTAGFNDFNPANASGSFTITDADLKHKIWALRALNGYLYIFGDNSVKQIGTITVSGSQTLFAILTLSSDQGTTFKDTIISYNRLVMFAAKTGVYGIFGATVQKLSDDLDGIFQKTNFTTIVPQAGLIDLNNQHLYVLLLSYNDPIAGNRPIMVAFGNSRWWVISQTASLQAISDVAISGVSALRQLWGSSGADITQLLSNTSTPVAITAQTALSHNGALLWRKKAVQAGFGANVTTAAICTMTIDTENGSLSYAFGLSSPIGWVNKQNQPVQWVNNSLIPVNFGALGFSFPHQTVNGAGKFLGATLTGTVQGFALNCIAISYQHSKLWG